MNLAAAVATAFVVCEVRHRGSELDGMVACWRGTRRTALYYSSLLNDFGASPCRSLNKYVLPARTVQSDSMYVWWWN